MKGRIFRNHFSFTDDVLNKIDLYPCFQSLRIQFCHLVWDIRNELDVTTLFSIGQSFSQRFHSGGFIPLVKGRLSFQKKCK